METLTAKLDKAGRLMIPQKFRQQLGLAEGSELLLRIENGELRAITREAAWKKAQEFCVALKMRSDSTRSVVDELREDRNRDLAAELGEDS